jgi:hypothetical protein
MDSIIRYLQNVVVSNWMSAYYSLEFLSVWEQVNNPNFNRMGHHTVRNAEVVFIRHANEIFRVTWIQSLQT